MMSPPKHFARGAAGFGLVLAVMACSKQAPPVSAESAHQPSALTTSRAAGIRWITPARWTVEAPRPMRVATYRIPAAPGDTEDAECGAFYFGPGQGGSVEANLRRWGGEFAAPTSARQDQEVVSNFIVHTLSITGTYLAAAGPMGPVTAKKPDFRLLGAIVEAPDGLIFFKLTGPEKTVSAAEPEFRTLLASLRRE
jgi:hypothetical protein